MLHWKSKRVWRVKQPTFAVCLQTVCRVKHWILPGYGRVIFIYTYIYILLPGHGREGYWIAATIVILDDTILYCIFVSLVANHCNEEMHVWQSWTRLSLKCWEVLDLLYLSCVSTNVLDVKSCAPDILQLTDWRLTVLNTSERPHLTFQCMVC